MTRRSVVCLAVVLASCAVDDELLELDTTTQQVAACPKWVCGSNDPVVSSSFGPPVKFHELSENPTVANAEGVTLIGLDVAGVTYGVDVAGAKLNGKLTGKPTVSGQNLVGTSLMLQAGAVRYNLRIIAVGATNLYPVDGATAETYQIDQRAVGETDPRYPSRNVCSQAGAVPTNELLGQNTWTLLLYENSRVNVNTKVLTEGDNTWFNLACAGHVLAKTFLVRHALASQNSTHATTLAERQTMLRMYLADYCGNGTPFTQSGEPLVWIDHKAWFQYFSPPLTLEARWGPNGAICLNEPRMFNTNAAGAALFPNIKQSIAALCAVPPCANLNPSSFLGAHLVSGNP